MKPESFEEKLYIARDIREEPNYKELEMVRKLEDKLAGDESFVGIAPFGSVVSGYSTEKSDIDVFVLYDDPGITKIDDLEKQTKSWEREIKENGKEANVLLQNINPELVIHDLKLGVKRGEPGEFVAKTLAEMSRIVTGKKIDRYRQSIASVLHTFTREQRDKIIGEVVESLVRRDKLSLFKRKQLMPELTEEDHQNILDKRKRMWEDRVRKIWDVSEA